MRGVAGLAASVEAIPVANGDTTILTPGPSPRRRGEAESPRFHHPFTHPTIAANLALTPSSNPGTMLGHSGQGTPDDRLAGSILRLDPIFEGIERTPLASIRSLR